MNEPRVIKLTKELGHDTTVMALLHAIEMRSALKALHTWAKIDGALVPSHVRELTNKALHYDK